jgi:phosphoglycerate dehydrogenase-like enzyme
MKYNLVFITDRGAWHQQSALEAAPEDFNVEILRNPGEDQLKNALKSADFLISERSGIIDKQLLESADQLKLIQRLGSLYHDIDLDQAESQGIAVCYQPIEGVIRVAEHLMLQILYLSKKTHQAVDISLKASPDWGESKATDEDTFAYNWSGMKGIGQVWNRTLGIIGLGEIGVELVRRLKGWDCEIKYHKRTQLPSRLEENLGISYQDPEQLLKESDIVVNLLPYLPATINYFDQAKISLITEGGILVSCGSGGTIDEEALALAIESGHLAGAALDSFAAEPLPDKNPLLRAAKKGANVLLTPHIAGGTYDNLQPGKPFRWRDYSNILRYLEKQPLEYRLV